MSKQAIPIEEQVVDQRSQAQPGRSTVPTFKRILPLAILLMMACVLVLLDAILPLNGLNSEDALLAHVSALTLLPTHLFFPSQAITLVLAGNSVVSPPVTIVGWRETTLLLNVFLLLFLLYLLALYALPRFISSRYLFYSTLLLGIVCLLFPIVTSSDIFSYIAYAHMEVFYHLNPLTTAPSAMHGDTIYAYLYWKDQPSAYGPTWALITAVAQWLLGLTGPANIVPMLVALRILGLASHIGSIILVWHISGQLQRLTGIISAQKRTRAVLAFAWNPLLLFEACVNAHNDAVLLFLILLAIWLLLRSPGLSLRTLLPAAIVFAFATCLKINVIVLVPGLLLFLWMQRPRHISHLLITSATYASVILLLYAPFWQHGAVLYLLIVNPATSRAINTPYDFLSQLFNALAHVPVPLSASGEPLATPIERLMHIFSAILFILVYAILCWRATRTSSRINTIPGLIRWMALAWLLYCALGSPWFWPWYLVTFFGLFALVESITPWNNWRAQRIPLAVRLLALSMLSLYCFFSWAPAHTGLFGFVWGDLRGLFAWAIPLLALYRPPVRILARLPKLCRAPLSQRAKATVLRG